MSPSCTVVIVHLSCHPEVTQSRVRFRKFIAAPLDARLFICSCIVRHKLSIIGHLENQAAMPRGSFEHTRNTSRVMTDVWRSWHCVLLTNSEGVCGGSSRHYSGQDDRPTAERVRCAHGPSYPCEAFEEHGEDGASGVNGRTGDQTRPPLCAR